MNSSFGAEEGPGAHARVVEVDIPSDVQYIERVVEIVRRECEVAGMASRQLTFNVPVALTEALSNAILRGNHEHPGKQVHVRASLDADRLVLEVSDEGQGFDIDACTNDPTTPENVAREDGRGLFLMRKLMDSVERLNGGSRNVVRLTLNRE